MKCGKKAGNKGWHLLMEDLGCQAEEFEICPAGSNGTIVANKCVFVVVVFSGFSTSRADSTLEFSQLFCFFFFSIFFLIFSAPLGPLPSRGTLPETCDM